MDSTVAQVVIAIFGSTGFMTGLWGFIHVRVNRKGALTQLVLGIAHEKIVAKGLAFIERGWMTADEYRDYYRYLVKPYRYFGGNGLADKVITDVDHLPFFKKAPQTSEMPIVNDIAPPPTQ